MSFYALLAAYGLCFGLQHKATFLQGRSAFTDALLHCTYCAGFHCGWLVWAGSAAAAETLSWSWPALADATVWAFSSAAFCYAMDAAVKWFEVNSVDG